MPYIKQDKRKWFDGFIESLQRGILEPGELNYCISKLCDFYGHDLSYKKINDIIGVLECAKQEYYRRIAAPYENLKCNENGEVYERSTS